MKCEIKTEYVAGIPNYKKVYLHFIKPETKTERRLCRDLEAVRYVFGKEPRFSLYVGTFPIQIALEQPIVRISDAPTATVTEFLDKMYADAPGLYTHGPCRCGMKFKTARSHVEHRRRCAVMKAFRPFLAYLETMETWKDAEQAGLVKRKSKKPPKSKRKDDVQASAKRARAIRIARAEKKAARKHKRKH